MSGFPSYQYLSDDGDDGGEVRDARSIFRPNQHQGPVIPRTKLTKELLQQQGEENALAFPPSISLRKNLDTEEFAKDPGAVARRDENLHLLVQENEPSKKNQSNVRRRLAAPAPALLTRKEQLMCARIAEQGEWMPEQREWMPRPAFERHRKAASRRAVTARTTQATSSLGRALSQQENMDPLEQGQKRMASRPHTTQTAKGRPLMEHNGRNEEEGDDNKEDHRKQVTWCSSEILPANDVFMANLKIEKLKKRSNPRRLAPQLPLADHIHKKTHYNNDDDIGGDEDEDTGDDTESSGTSPFSKSPSNDSATSTPSPKERSNEDSPSPSSGERSYEKDLKDILERAAGGDFRNSDDEEEQDQSMKSPLREEWKEPHQSTCQMAGGALDDVEVANDDVAKEDEEEEADEASSTQNKPDAKPEAKANLPNNVVDPFKADLQATRALILQGGLEKRKSQDGGHTKGTDPNAAAIETKTACTAAIGTLTSTGTRGLTAFASKNDHMLGRQDSTRTLQTSHVDGRKRKHGKPTESIPHVEERNKKKSSFSSITAGSLSDSELAIEFAIDEFCDNLHSSVIALRQKMKQAMGMPPSIEDHAGKLLADVSKTKDRAEVPDKNQQLPANHGSNRSFQANSTGHSGTSSGYPVAPQHYGGLPTYRPPSVPPYHHSAPGSISAVPLPGPYVGVSTGCQPPPGTYYADPYSYGYFQPLPGAPSCPPLPEMYGWNQHEASTMTGYQHGAHSQATRDTPHDRPTSRASHAPQK